jgi:hypothetical protein
MSSVNHERLQLATFEQAEGGGLERDLLVSIWMTCIEFPMTYQA